MPAFLMPPIRAKFFNSDGTPLAFGKVYTAMPGTMAGPGQGFPKVSYTSSDATAAHSNPIYLDSNGEASIWLDGFYSIDVEDATGAVVYTADNVSAGSISSGGGTGGVAPVSGMVVIPTLADLIAYNVGDGQVSLIYMSGRLIAGDGGQGFFWWSSSDFSVQVSADTLQGVYVAPASAPDGASGSWIRTLEGSVAPEMFGAVGDGVADDTLPLRESILSAQRMILPVMPRRAVSGIAYRTTAKIVIDNIDYEVPYINGGASGFVISSPEITNDAQIEVRGRNENILVKFIEGVYFIAGGGTSVNLRLNGCSGYAPKRCAFTNSKYGLEFSTDLASGTATALCVGQQNEFLATCQTAIHYVKGAGTGQFEGTGVRQGTIINDGTHSAVVIEADCQVNGAPLDIAVKSVGNSAGLVNNSALAVFEGIIKVFGGGNVLASGPNPVYLIGEVSSQLYTEGRNEFGGLIPCFSCKVRGVNLDYSPIPVTKKITVGATGMLVTQQLVPIGYAVTATLVDIVNSQTVTFTSGATDDGTNTVIPPVVLSGSSLSVGFVGSESNVELSVVDGYLCFTYQFSGNPTPSTVYEIQSRLTPGWNYYGTDYANDIA